ncbi:TD and POZ domain-containing protein 2 [Rhynchospora pubera]|uniref:TD and POZ domain-containing protein 2 n=1 Tax=Rhynchospora pubera TaxID=906938 RepID=A0AAV8DID8_9POAL|nr:TD and POZ domain-containing protein 2 [Rhynchospora pubera]KAJ4766076.1 TD and POZ domain-containing protein 2 [Rhynchospora pubera]
MNPIRATKRIKIAEELPEGSMLPENIRRPGETNEMADVKFIVEGEIFSAHRAVLGARLAVFKAELSESDSAAEREEVIPIMDMQAAVFKLLLEFMYTDNLPEDASFEIIQGLMVAANKYALEGLVVRCQQRLIKNLTLDTGTDYLIFADQNGFSKLKKECLQFLSKEDIIRKLALSLKHGLMGVNHPSLLHELREVYESRTLF